MPTPTSFLGSHAARYGVSMARHGSLAVRSRRPLIAALGSLVMGVAGPATICAAAPLFDDIGYSTCTASTNPSPDQSLDDVTTSCCVNHGGVPASTMYGIGCVAQVDNPPPDYRPTIVMPTWAAPPGEDDARLDELDKLSPLLPPS
jgi:hypothetical protein